MRDKSRNDSDIVDRFIPTRQVITRYFAREVYRIVIFVDIGIYLNKNHLIARVKDGAFDFLYLYKMRLNNFHNLLHTGIV